eukprot:1376869-Pleurochrysis_carterae.AAC.5
MRQGRTRRLRTRSAGVACEFQGTVDLWRMRNLRRNASRFFSKNCLAAVVGEPGEKGSAYCRRGRLGSRKLQFRSACVAQTVHLQILCCKVVEAQRVAKAKC